MAKKLAAQEGMLLGLFCLYIRSFLLYIIVFSCMAKKLAAQEGMLVSLFCLYIGSLLPAYQVSFTCISGLFCLHIRSLLLYIIVFPCAPPGLLVGPSSLVLLVCSLLMCSLVPHQASSLGPPLLCYQCVLY
jgi:hypothetical protein